MEQQNFNEEEIQESLEIDKWELEDHMLEDDYSFDNDDWYDREKDQDNLDD